MGSRSLLHRAEQLVPGFLDRLKTLVDIDSPTEHAPGLAATAEVVKRYMQDLGAEVEVVPPAVGVGDILVGQWKGSGKSRFLLLAHRDTVHKVGTAAANPFRIDGRRVFGPGVLDDKGGIVLALETVRLLRETGFDGFGTITLLVNGDEEKGGSAGSRDLIMALAREHDYAFVFEFGSSEDIVTNWRKGIGYLKMAVKGKSAHAGAEPEKGCNAAVELAHQILQMGDLGNPEKATTVNFTVLQSGERYNVIPDTARAQADVRVLHPEELVRLDQATASSAARKLLPCAAVDIRVDRGRPPFPPNPATDALVAKAQAIYQEIGLTLGVEGSGAGTDGNYTAAAGTTTLDAMGPVGGGAHTMQEYIDLDRLAPRLYLLSRLIVELSR